MLCCSSITETVCADPAFASGWPGEAADVTQAANAIAAEMEISPRLASLVCMFDLPLRCSNANQAIFVSAAVQRSGDERRKSTTFGCLRLCDRPNLFPLISFFCVLGRRAETKQKQSIAFQYAAEGVWR